MIEILDGFGNIFSTIFSAIENVIGIIGQGIDFITKVITFIPNQLGILPQELNSFLTPILAILLLVFIYRFLR